MVSPNKERLKEMIREMSFDAPGSSGKSRLYHEIPFDGYEDLNIARKENKDRLHQLTSSYNFSGKRVLDIGCSVGYYSFKLAELGAECWGIDADENSIFVANALKKIHSVDNVHFRQNYLTNSVIKDVLDESRGFDVVLVFSVIHWLIKMNRNERNVIALLRNLVKDRQVIFYEPAISGKAYYPEILENKSVGKFLKHIGYNEFSYIGSNYAQNVFDSRELYRGDVNIDLMLRQFFEEINSKGKECRNVRNITKFKEGKSYVYKYFDYVIKYNNLELRENLDRPLFENESYWLNELQRYSFIPKFFGKYEIGAHTCLVMEHIDGVSLNNAWWVFDEKFDKYIPKLLDELYYVLECFRKEGITHKDIRPHNIIINRDLSIFKIIDFQFCTRIGKDIQVVGSKEKLFYEKCLRNVGGEWRKPNLSEFTYETDKYSVEKIINNLTPAKKSSDGQNKSILNNFKKKLKKLF